MVGIAGLRTGLQQAQFGTISSRVLTQGAVRDTSTERRRLGDFADQLRTLRRGVDDLRALFRPARLASRKTQNARVETSSLGLNTVPTRAERRSGAEINTLTTSTSPSSLSFSGTSTATADVSGTYDGSLGDQQISVSVVGGGTVGGTGTRSLEFREADGTLIETVSAVLDGGSGEEVVSTSFGVELRFSSGLLVAGDGASLAVSASQGPTVDPDAAFDGSGGGSAGLEAGLVVSDGSFDLDGTSIDVFASDSISDVLQRINSSAADVTATYDAASEGIVLTADTAGSSPDLLLSGDTSGFLAAVKLDAPQFMAGVDDERDLALGDTNAFSAVSSGSFSVNGVSISVDPTADSLNDLIGRINSSGAGVEASFDAQRGRLSLESTDRETPLELSADESGFLDAIDLDEGVTLGDRERRGLRGVDRRRLEQRLNEIMDGIREILTEVDSGNIRVEQSRLRSSLRSSLDDVFLTTPEGSRESDGTLKTSLGLTLGLGTEVEEEDIAALDRRALETAIRRDPEAVFAFFSEDRKDEGTSFVTTLESVLSEAEEGFAERFGGGLLLNRLG